MCRVMIQLFKKTAKRKIHNFVNTTPKKSKKMWVDSLTCLLQKGGRRFFDYIAG